MYVGILSSLFTLALFAALIFGLVRLLGGGKRGAGGRDEPGAVLRRVVLLGALFVSFVVAAIGASTILTEVLGGDRFGDTGSRVARGMSFLIVAVPAIVLLLRYLLPQLEDNVRERRSVAWTAYLNLMLATSLVVTMVSAILAVARALEVWEAGPLASFIVWGVVWSYHWFVLLARYGGPGEIHLAFGSTAGLVTLAGGLGTALALPLTRAYDSLGDGRIASSSLADGLTVAVTVAVVGAVVWWWHWLSRYVGARRDALWHTYVIVPGVLGGTLAAVGSLVWALGASLIWFAGDPSPADGLEFFAFLPTTLVVLAMGTLVWWYHRDVLRSRGVPERTEPVRVYDYVMAAVGLLAAAAGSTVLIVALVSALTSSAVAAGDDSSINALIVGVTLLATGVPLWWGFWRRVEAIAATDPTERASETRRVYLFGIFGVGGLTAFISLIALLYGILDPLLNGNLDSAAIREVRVSLALVFTVGALSWFTFTVWRADRAVIGTEQPEAFTTDVVLVTSDAELGDALRDRLGGRVEVWHRVHDGGAAVDANALAEMVRASHEHHVLVVTGEGDPIIVPFEP